MSPDESIERVAGRIAAALGPAALPQSSSRVAERADRAAASGPLARRIDHTLLKADATPLQIETLCEETRHYGFASVCVNPSYVALCRQLLSGSDSAVCTVAGFPLGATTTEVKRYETQQAIENGAREIDMVLPIGQLKAGNYAAVFADIAAVVAACHEQAVLCKVIIEAVLLNDEEKIAACLLAARAGADFVKTSTGFAASGATVHDVALMRRVVGEALGVKAAGGVRTWQDAQAMLAAGANRIGASSSVQIVTGGPS